MMVSQFDGPIVFTIFFQDGDGDIGFEDADSSALFLTDERFPLTEGYHIPPQTPGGAELTIQGTWELHLDHTILMDPYASSETATFRLKLRDRAGNWSNEVVSPPITITQ